MKMLLNFLLRFLGRWFARSSPEASQEVEKGIDAVIPDPRKNLDVRIYSRQSREKREKLRIGGNPSK